MSGEKPQVFKNFGDTSLILTAFVLFSYFIEMRDAMHNCLTTIKVLSFLLDVVYDIKEWLAPHAEQLHDHTQPKCFKCVRNSSGKCEMFYRNYSHMQWEGPVIVLKVNSWLSCVVILSASLELF